MSRSPVEADLGEALSRTEDLFRGLRGARLFLTGGTGFFGSWLLETLVHANRKLGLGARAVVLTRDAAAFRAKRPELASCDELVFHAGDVRDFEFPRGSFTHMVHAAVDVDERMNREQPGLVKDVIVKGTARVLELAAGAGVERSLFVSSGAVYGRQRPETTHVAEDDPGLSSRIDPPSAYAEGKREAEALCLAAEGARPAIARGFAFVGPYLPMDRRFAIGNFIGAALRGGPVEIKGDGTPYRSYLYACDLAVWLWTILLKGEPGRAYNVGSERRVSVDELARIVARAVGRDIEVRVARRPEAGAPAEQYVPSAARARQELGLREIVALEDAVRRTADWAKMQAARAAR